MIIGIETTIKRMEKEENPTGGTLAVITGHPDFTRTDGYIQFMKLVFGRIPETYGKQDGEWQEQLDRLYAAAEKFQDANTAFTGNTFEEFDDYCARLWRVMERPAGHLEAIGLDIVTSDDLLLFLQECADKNIKYGFYYEESEGMNKGLMDDLMDQLNRLKLEKPGRLHNISYLLRGTGLMRSAYHDHVYDALNVILGAAVYAVNCKSTKDGDAYAFDIEKLDNELMYAEYLMAWVP